MNRVVFLLEEFSMKVLLDGLLPRLVPGLPFLCVAHDGWPDLEKSIPRKLRAWREPGVRFVVVRDNDGRDCRQLKLRLETVCKEGGRDDVVIRLACQELESWYLGAPEALADAYGDDRLRDLGLKARFRDPDSVAQPSVAIKELLPEYQKVSGARRMAACLARENGSHSFGVLMDRLEQIASEIDVDAPPSAGS